MKELEALIQSQNLSITAFLLGAIVAFVLAMLIRAHYLRYSTVLANRHDLANLLPFIALTVMLVISVVKSSLALSLGLVGALSIVRFRTPVKEPEDLGYIFIAIGVGLGTGAGQIAVTTIAVPLILAGVTLVKRRGEQERKVGAYNLSLRLQGQDLNPETSTSQLLRIVGDHCALLDVSRVDMQPTQLSLLLNIEMQRQSDLNALMRELREAIPEVELTFLDHQTVSRI